MYYIRNNNYAHCLLDIVPRVEKVPIDIAAITTIGLMVQYCSIVNDTYTPVCK